MSKHTTKSAVHSAIQYTLLISALYIVYQYVSPASPSGKEFIPFIVPMVLTNIVFIIFPLLLVIFYFKDRDTLENFKPHMFKKDSEDSELHSRETLREYHAMLKEGIITQEEYDNIKKKHLKNLHKDK